MDRNASDVMPSQSANSDVELALRTLHHLEPLDRVVSG
jgi:hypothetical protein